MKTYFPRKADIKRQRHTIDASGKVLGRLATQIATLLKGKHKPTYTPHMDMGDYVVVVNAAQVRVTGKKAKDKLYYRHSGYPGGLRQETFEEVVEKDPERVIRLAVKRMLPNNPLGRAMLKKLQVYPGPQPGVAKGEGK